VVPPQAVVVEVIIPVVGVVEVVGVAEVVGVEVVTMAVVAAINNFIVL
jgi:hypothetical protein